MESSPTTCRAGKTATALIAGRAALTSASPASTAAVLGPFGPDWPSTAVVILWDDSDGWYDHAHQIVNSSSISVPGYDVLNGSRERMFRCQPVVGHDDGGTEP